MTDEIVVPSEGARKKPFILFRIAQWVVAAFVGILTVVPLADTSKLAIPGAPVALLWSALAALVLAAVVLSPPLFFRLPLKAKVGGSCPTGWCRNRRSAVGSGSGQAARAGRLTMGLWLTEPRVSSV
ncbi:hypothetical protein, partial [Novosphingobium sp. NDB2Meth1]|uniref:hypothetical protein n=1 Tax=Novosphingobium sp. NDB2Meth1 TaxID=1892847 RepID=UPI000B191B66